MCVGPMHCTSRLYRRLSSAPVSQHLAFQTNLHKPDLEHSAKCGTLSKIWGCQRAKGNPSSKQSEHKADIPVETSRLLGHQTRPHLTFETYDEHTQALTTRASYKKHLIFSWPESWGMGWAG
eukprot:6477471-Amphidinium_carterae.1